MESIGEVGLVLAHATRQQDALECLLNPLFPKPRQQEHPYLSKVPRNLGLVHNIYALLLFNSLPSFVLYYLR